jgi:hypothetical protein
MRGDARRLLLITALGLAVCVGAAGEAAAKGVGAMPAPGGVIVPGGKDRYIAISPRIPGATTVVARVKRDGGKLGRWWHLRGTWFVPAVAYDLSPGGLSADGGTLVLQRFNRAYPPRRSRFAILDTERSFEWRRPGRPPRFRRFFDHLDLRGDYSFDAISPDGSTVYLIHRHLPPSSGGSYITNYEVRALDVESGELLPQPIVDPEEPDERMAGLPVTRATSPDGRWAYTLYDGDGGEPFIHALDTVGRRAVCVDLPQLEGRRNRFMLRMRIEQQGQRLTVLSGPPPPRELPPLAQGRPVSSSAPQPLLSVDTESFEVEPAASSGKEVDDGSFPWLPLGIAGVALAFALAWLGQRTGRPAAGKPPAAA